MDNDSVEFERISHSSFVTSVDFEQIRQSSLERNAGFHQIRHIHFEMERVCPDLGIPQRGAHKTKGGSKSDPLCGGEAEQAPFHTLFFRCLSAWEIYETIWASTQVCVDAFSPRSHLPPGKICRVLPNTVLKNFLYYSF